MTILYFFLAALGLGLLVFIHELGHYFAAKKTGMVVETFSIGFGRPIIKWQWQGVDWQIGWLPFGGYVKILGMDVSKHDEKEPYEIPNGFFAQSPLKRIFVAVAGPLANFILAIVIFCVLWGIGGRVKPFSEYTQITGWVDPKSEIFAKGVRPGDILTSYNGKPFNGAKDLLYAAMLSGNAVTWQGEHVDYAHHTFSPFQETVKTYPLVNSLDGLETTGIMSTARYLIYQQPLDNGSLSALQPGSPMAQSGLQSADRLVWADGELLFSMEQLGSLANSSFALVTVQRGKTTILSKQPRVLLEDLNVPSHVRDELQDWRYELNLTSRLQQLYTLPYVINTEGYIEAPLAFIDEQVRQEAFLLHPQDPALQQPLEPGDKILAVDGMKVRKGSDIFKLLQTHFVQIIVKENNSLDVQQNWKKEDEQFFADWDVNQILALAQTIGTDQSKQSLGNYRLLAPVQPQSLMEFPLSVEEKKLLEEDYQAQQEQASAIKNPEQRQAALQMLQQSYHKKIFGIPLQDCFIKFNPNPFALFGTVFTETWQTLKALVMGYLHPKWLSGPVGIVRVIHHGWRVGVGEALFWMGAISVNLGFLNLLPIPVLDGGYICLSLLELITRKRLKSKTMWKIIIPFTLLLIGFLIFLTFQDIARLF
ncbi:MAG: site-2 protease family protein [Verrucomicrobia bacterium]|nr:site-2 protease family protein [Verrucomicrobiota bacterium]MBS0645252.1 site-2 protease family protein [Verrucomicrobiota bacterium]